jgi:predicted nucleic acid-binding protein
MIQPVLVDTGAWFAMAVPWDANHQGALEWLQREKRSLLTTDYIGVQRVADQACAVVNDVARVEDVGFETTQRPSINHRC